MIIDILKSLYFLIDDCVALARVCIVIISKATCHASRFLYLQQELLLVSLVFLEIIVKFICFGN